MQEKYISIREKKWKDLEDNNYIYKKGDIYPREGLEPTKKRIKELASTKNKIGEVLIQKIEDEIDNELKNNAEEEVLEENNTEEIIESNEDETEEEKNKE